MQLYIDHNPHLVFGYSGLKHFQLLEQLLEREHISFKRTLLGPDIGPEIKGERYELVGAGWANIGENGCELDLDSKSYKISIDEEHRQKMIVLCPNFLIVRREFPKGEPCLRSEEKIPPRTVDDIPF